MAALTAPQLRVLNNLATFPRGSSPGTRIFNGETLQHPGRIATGHIRVATNANDTDTVTVNGVVYEFDTGGAITAGRVLVTIGGTAALSATALATAISQRQGNSLKAAAHATDTTVVDIASRVVGAPFALATSSGGRLIVQDNGEELARNQYLRVRIDRVVTAEDVTRTRVRVDTGLTSLVGRPNYRIITSTALNTELAWNGTTTVTGGVIEFTVGTAAALAAGNLIILDVEGLM